VLHSTDGKPHVFDFNYHNFGKQTMQLQTAPYSGFPLANGYTHLEQVQRGETSGSIMTRFDNEGTTLSLEYWVANLTATADKDGIITVHGPKWIDTVSLGPAIRYNRSSED
jgi:hypothetical protein